jgi:hypothetical protein
MGCGRSAQQACDGRRRDQGVPRLITIDGEIETIKDGFEGPVSLAQVGDTISVLDTPLKYLLGSGGKKTKYRRHSRRRRSKRPSSSLKSLLKTEIFQALTGGERERRRVFP